jgi:hypothetical protein
MKKNPKTSKKKVDSSLNFSTDWKYAPAPEGTEHIKLQKSYDLFINGKIVATCPTDACVYTLKNVIIPTVEYSARLTDSLNRETWTELKGTERQ